MSKLTKFAAALAFGLAAVSASASACEVNNFTTDSVRNLVMADGGWPIPDSWCPILEANPDIKIVVDSDQFIGLGRAEAWAMVTVRDGFGVVSPNSQVSTRMSPSADSNAANALQYEAIQHALQGFDLQANINWLRVHDHQLINYIKSHSAKGSGIAP
jgi:hypothetical protein